MNHDAYRCLDEIFYTQELCLNAKEWGVIIFFIWIVHSKPSPLSTIKSLYSNFSYQQLLILHNIVRCCHIHIRLGLQIASFLLLLFILLFVSLFHSLIAVYRLVNCPVVSFFICLYLSCCFIFQSLLSASLIILSKRINAEAGIWITNLPN